MVSRTLAAGVVIAGVICIGIEVGETIPAGNVVDVTLVASSMLPDAWAPPWGVEVVGMSVFVPQAAKKIPVAAMIAISNLILPILAES